MIALSLFGGGWVLGAVLFAAAVGCWTLVWLVGCDPPAARAPVREALPAAKPAPIVATYRRPVAALPPARGDA